MKKSIIFLMCVIAFSCAKDHEKEPEKQPPEPPKICGKILSTPVLDSFIYPTYYISMPVLFDDGTKLVHVQDNVTGDHDGSWFLTKYDKDKTFCKTLP